MIASAIDEQTANPVETQNQTIAMHDAEMKMAKSDHDDQSGRKMILKTRGANHGLARNSNNLGSEGTTQLMRFVEKATVNGDVEVEEIAAGVASNH